MPPTSEGFLLTGAFARKLSDVSQSLGTTELHATT